MPIESSRLEQSSRCRRSSLCSRSHSSRCDRRCSCSRSRSLSRSRSRSRSPADGDEARVPLAGLGEPLRSCENWYRNVVACTSVFRSFRNCCVRLCSRGTGAALDSHLTPSTKSVRDVITDTAHTRNRKPDTERHVTTNNYNYRTS